MNFKALMSCRQQCGSAGYLDPWLKEVDSSELPSSAPGDMTVIEHENFYNIETSFS